MAEYTHITVNYSFRNKIATITLRRPNVHNALNAQLIQNLTSAFTALASNEGAVVRGGAVLAEIE